jgi:nicotinamide mononucleotide adenylyltransferase
MDLSTRHQDYLRKIKKRWMDENKKYKENVEHMKEFKEEQFQKKTKDLVKRLKEKEKLYLTSFRDKQKSRMKERQKAIDLLMEREKNAREKVNKYMEKEEIKRLKLQKTSTDKGKKYFFYYNKFCI